MGIKAELFVKAVDENLFCSICHDIFEDPVSCMHGHTFCKVCICEWLKTSSNCPLEPLSASLSQNSLVPQFTIKGIIDNLEVYCDPHFVYSKLSIEGDHGFLGLTVTVGGNAEDFETGCNICDWVGKVPTLTQHRKTCPFQEVQCSHAECSQKMQRRDLEQHENTCEFRKVECDNCGMILCQNAKEKHMIDDCLQTLTVCPNRCTDTKQQIFEVKRIDLDDHLRTECVKTILDCPFKDQGCSIQVERQHVDKHVQDNMAAHMMLLAKQCSLLTKQNSSLTEQNTTLTEQTTALTEKSSALEEECLEMSQGCLWLAEKNRLLQEQLIYQLKQNCSYTWRINDFHTLCWKHSNGSAFTSPIFWLRGYRLCFLVYPHGSDKESEGWLSLYLNLSEEYPKSRKFLSKAPSNIHNAAIVKYGVSVGSVTDGVDDVSVEAIPTLEEQGNWGWPFFMKTCEALSTAYCDITNGSLTIQCTILQELDWDWDLVSESESESETESQAESVA